jgi:hypothetical protein
MSEQKYIHNPSAMLADVDTWRRWQTAAPFDYDPNYPSNAEASAALNRILDAIPELLGDRLVAQLQYLAQENDRLEYSLQEILKIHVDSGTKIKHWCANYGGSWEQAHNENAPNSCAECGDETEHPCLTYRLAVTGLPDPVQAAEPDVEEDEQHYLAGHLSPDIEDDTGDLECVCGHSWPCPDAMTESLVHIISIKAIDQRPGMFFAECSCGNYLSSIGPETEIRRMGDKHVATMKLTALRQYITAAAPPEDHDD